MITKDTIDDIFSAVRIEEIISEFVSLKKRGVNFVGLCPFHNEKTPSFTVSATKGIYKCFGCGKAGNAVNFLMEHEHFTYPEALRFLAKKYNIEIQEDKSDLAEKSDQNKKEPLFIVSDFAQKYFSDVLFNSEDGKAIGLSYFTERGFGEQTIRKFQLGYCPGKWDSFTLEALDKGYKLEYLKETGLTIEKDGKYFDRFRGRAMFPIHNLSGRVIGFGGRVLGSETQAAKYVNSPESEIYSKSNVLYGMYFARNSIIENKNCYLVEGYTDVISLHQAGIENVVASSGTSLTTEQIRLIHRYANTITILYDGDAAGIKASFRGIDMIFEEGLNVRLVLFPENEDPDSFTKKHRTSEVKKFIDDNVVNFITFKTLVLFEEAKSDPVKRAGFIKEIANTIALIPDGIVRSEYIKECAEKVKISEQILNQEINKIRRKKVFERKTDFPVAEEIEEEKIISERQTDFIENYEESQESNIIRLMLEYGHKELVFREKKEKEIIEHKINVAEYIINELLNDVEFENPLYKRIFEEFSTELKNNKILNQQHFIDHSDKEIKEQSINIILSSEKNRISENWKKHGIVINDEEKDLPRTIIQSIAVLKLKKILKLKEEALNRLKMAVNDEEILFYQNLCKKFDKAKQTIANSKELGRIIIK
ncbi:MAG: DNA primase [Bacteroidales bacterium]|nr:DNA primase [Bacteroidales bacterium]